MKFTKRTTFPVKIVPPPQPTNPFRDGIKKFLVAQRFISGYTDRGRMAREIGVSVHSIRTVASDLTWL
jgi:hypothetical protein